MNLKARRFLGSFLLYTSLLFCSGCGILMGTVIAPLYYIKEEVIKPVPLKVKMAEAAEAAENNQKYDE